MSKLQVQVQGVGLFGPGLSGWQQSAGIVAGRAPLVMAPISLPPAEALPAAERRRAGTSIKLAFAAGFDAPGKRRPVHPALRLHLDGR